LRYIVTYSEEKSRKAHGEKTGYRALGNTPEILKAGPVKQNFDFPGQRSIFSFRFIFLSLKRKIQYPRSGTMKFRM
jgi:hypothetical protein